MHPVLKAAIENPRFARPYGSDRGEWGFETGISGVDNFINMNNVGRGSGLETFYNERRSAFQYGENLFVSQTKH
jgi:hypothetical protein